MSPHTPEESENQASGSGEVPKAVNRRGFFRDLLLRGLTKAEDKTRLISQRLEKVVLQDPSTRQPPQPSPPSVQITPASGTIPRGGPNPKLEDQSRHPDSPPEAPKPGPDSTNTQEP